MSEPASLGTYNGFEIYPMPMFATLTVEDPAALADWYQRALGFSTMFAGPVLHLRRRKYQDLLIMRGPSAEAAGSAGLRLSFNADGEIDELATRAHAVPALGLSQVEGPIDTPWNTRDLRVTDPAGNRLIFTGRRDNPDPEISQRWQEAFEAGRRPPSGEVSEPSTPKKSDSPA
jgi:hypothetical protein